MNLPEAYVVSKLFQFAGAPRYNRSAKTYNASCPICREGKSWLRKKRLYYVPQENSFFCHNCGWKGSSYKWIKEVTGLTYSEIMKDSESYETYDANKSIKISPPVTIQTLPGDCINLFDVAQTTFYKSHPSVTAALDYVKKRKMDVAANRPTSLYLCRDPKGVHDKRIVIPFFDHTNKIVFYQSRGFMPNDTRPKYLSKAGGDRSLFNLNKIDPSTNTVFTFEGPINAFFVKNSIAVGGIQENSFELFSSKQHEQIEIACKFYDMVWVLDSQWLDSAAYKKSLKLVEMKQKVFIWPSLLGLRYKDFNDVCIALDMQEITPQFILANTFEGLEASVRLRQIPEP